MVRNIFGRMGGLVLKIWNIVKTEGCMVGARRIFRQLFQKMYRKYYFCHVVKMKEEVLSEQKKEAAQGTILFSIIVPTYNTPIAFFREMVDSCVNQTYDNWELCIADGSDSSYGEIEDEARKWMGRDARIRYRRLERNGGISENTNEALRMAKGDYMVLLDHDDLLHPAALYENNKMIRESSADFLFSNEVVFQDRTSNIVALHIKPDFSFDTLRGNNFICHLCVFSADLLMKAGMLQREFDGSQDHDMILRLCEKAGRIVRIPKILYFWRVHAGSSANDTGKKSYAAVAGRKAVQKHLERIGLEGEVRSVENAPTYYLIDYSFDSGPKVGIYVIYEDENNLKAFVQSVVEHTTYKNYEVTVCCKEQERGVAENILSGYVDLLGSNAGHVYLYEEGKGEIYEDAIRESGADYLLFCDARIRIMTEDWMEKMLMYGQRKEIDFVVPKIVDERGRVGDTGGDLTACMPEYGRLFRCFDTEDDGQGIGKNTVVLYDHRESNRSSGHMGRMLYAHNVTVVSGVCMMIEKEKYQRGKVGACRKGKGRYCWLQGKRNSNLWTPQCVLGYEGKF